MLRNVNSLIKFNLIVIIIILPLKLFPTFVMRLLFRARGIYWPRPTAISRNRFRLATDRQVLEFLSVATSSSANYEVSRGVYEVSASTRRCLRRPRRLSLVRVKVARRARRFLQFVHVARKPRGGAFYRSSYDIGLFCGDAVWRAREPRVLHIVTRCAVSIFPDVTTRFFARCLWNT